MPVKNPDPRFVREAIDSVLRQDEDDLEIIVVEDPSDRSAKDIVASLSDERISYVAGDEPTSHVRQINRGIELARSELVAHMDADDVAEPSRLRVELDAMASAPEVDVLGSFVSVIDAEGKFVGLRDYPQTHEQILRAMRRINPMAHSTVLYRKRAVIEAGGYQDQVYPAIDYNLWCRAARRGARFMNLRSRLVRARVHSGEIKVDKVKDTIRATRWIKRTYWGDELGSIDRLRLLGEKAMLALPDDWVLRLFMAAKHKRHRPGD
jgi:glycosyltransferase involved in cell wall biosynthesis